MLTFDQGGEVHPPGRQGTSRDTSGCEGRELGHWRRGARTSSSSSRMLVPKDGLGTTMATGGKEPASTGTTRVALIFDSNKRRIDIDPGDVRDFEAGTVFVERHKRRGRRPRHKRGRPQQKTVS
jgi:hypothetical protein